MAETQQPVTLGGLFAEARLAFGQAGIEDAALDARLIVEHFAQAGRAESILEPQREVDAACVLAVHGAMERRLAGEPVHRIIGFRDFYGVRLELSRGTLEPRPDTETLVDLVLPEIRCAVEAFGECRFLDLGTGTGAIALSLLKEEPRASAIATDICDDALATARRNADMNGVGERFQAIRSDWFEAIAGRFHIIVSNPPYIAANQIADLQREVREYDPRAALDGGKDGLTAYRAIAGGAAAHLTENGRVAVEIGHDQKRDVEAIFAQAGFVPRAAASDLGGRDRALVFTR